MITKKFAHSWTFLLDASKGSIMKILRAEKWFVSSVVTLIVVSAILALTVCSLPLFVSGFNLPAAVYPILALFVFSVVLFLTVFVRNRDLVKARIRAHCRCMRATQLRRWEHS